MLKNNFLIAWRNLKRDKLFAALNIFGLAIGIVACLLIYVHVVDELSFDAHHRKADRIYRVQSLINYGDKADAFGITPYPIVGALLGEFPEIETGAAMLRTGKTFLEYEGEQHALEHSFYVDTTFFRIFDLRFLAGGVHALDKPDNIVIGKKLAQRIFGADDPMGRLLKAPGRTLEVAGVLDEDAFNTHIPISLFLSAPGMLPESKAHLTADWGNHNTFSYLVLSPEADVKGFQAKLDRFVEERMRPEWGSEFQGSIQLRLEPLREIHFNNTLTHDGPNKGNRAYVILLAMVAILILAVGCINFINMSTADATRRAREVALRKVVGAQRQQLIVQFIGGSVMVTCLAITLALVLLWLTLPGFNSISGKTMSMGRILEPGLVGVLLVIVLLVGVLAGSYPAFFLARFNPQLLLKEGIPASGRQGVRKVLMGLQFVIALFLLVSTMMVHRQLEWMRSKDLGFRKENLLAVTMPTPQPQDTLNWSALRAVKTEMMHENFVEGGSFTWTLPGQERGRRLLLVDGPDGPMNHPMPTMFVDADFPEVIGMQLLAGRFFDPDIPEDRFRSVVVNESAVRTFGWKEPLNERIRFPGAGDDAAMRVIGVVKDIHYTSLHSPIEPLCIFPTDPRYSAGTLLLRLSPGDVARQMDMLSARWNGLALGKRWEATFLTDSFAQLYQAEDRLFRVFSAFTVLALLLTAMGLYALAYFTARQRTKEIGIRRVLGASVHEMILQLNSEFILLLGIAMVIAFPLTWVALARWLEGFAYHTSISPVLFIASLLVISLVTVFTVSFQAWRVAVADPVKALRHE